MYLYLILNTNVFKVQNLKIAESSVFIFSKNRINEKLRVEKLRENEYASF